MTRHSHGGRTGTVRWIRDQNLESLASADLVLAARRGLVAVRSLSPGTVGWGCVGCVQHARNRLVSATANCACILLWGAGVGGCCVVEGKGVERMDGVVVPVKICGYVVAILYEFAGRISAHRGAERAHMLTHMSRSW